MPMCTFRSFLWPYVGAYTKAQSTEKQLYKEQASLVIYATNETDS